MINQHPIIPLPEQVDEWFDDAVRFNSLPKYYIATQAAQWGADHELEACVAWLDATDCKDPQETLLRLRWHRRPKPPSLKEQALEALDYLPSPVGKVSAARHRLIRLALEALDD